MDGLSLNHMRILGESDCHFNPKKWLSKRIDNILNIQAFGGGEICILKGNQDVRRKRSVASPGD